MIIDLLLKVRPVATQTPGSSALPATHNTPPPITRTPTRHIKTLHKIKNWSLTVRHKWLILGDSNVSRFPPYNISNLQIKSFPGASFVHLRGVLEKIDSDPRVEIVILSLGINNRTQNFPLHNPPFTPKSTSTPPLIDLLYEIKKNIKDNEYFATFNCSNPNANLTNKEIGTLNSLRNNNGIVIKPAEKGIVVVVLDREQYIWEATRHKLLY